MAAQFAGTALRRDISSKPLLQHTEGNRSHSQSASCFARTWRCASAAPSLGHGDVTLLAQTQRGTHAAQGAAVAIATVAPRCWHADRCNGASHITAAAWFATSTRISRGRAGAEVGRHAAAGQFFARQLHSAAACATAPDRPASSSAPDEHGWSLEYQGTVSTTIRTLKAVSITTAGMALLGCPPYLYFTLDGTYTALKVLSAVGFSSFGVFTTGAALWLGSACVFRENPLTPQCPRLDDPGSRVLRTERFCGVSSSVRACNMIRASLVFTL